MFKGTAGTDQEIKAWRQTLNPNMSAAQFKAAVDTAVELLSSRVNALKDQWAKGSGMPSDFHFLSPKARDTLSGMGYDANAIDQGGQEFPGVTPAQAGDTVPGVNQPGRVYYDANGNPIKKPGG